MNPKPLQPDDSGQDINERELLKLIADSLGALTLDLTVERDKRIYLAYLAARQIEDGLDDSLRRRLDQLRGELGL